MVGECSPSVTDSNLSAFSTRETSYFMPILTMSNNVSNPDMDNVCSQMDFHHNIRSTEETVVCV